MSQGPLPTDYAKALVTGHGMLGADLRHRMALSNRMAGLKMAQADNRVMLDCETDALACRARVFMSRMLEAAGARYTNPRPI